MSGFTIQCPEQQKAETQNLSTSLYPHMHARCHQRAYCSSTSSVAQSDVFVCDRAFLEQSMPIERRSGRHAPSVNAAGKLRRVRKRRCRSQAQLELIQVLTKRFQLVAINGGTELHFHTKEIAHSSLHGNLLCSCVAFRNNCRRKEKQPPRRARSTCGGSSTSPRRWVNRRAKEEKMKKEEARIKTKVSTQQPPPFPL